MPSDTVQEFTAVISLVGTMFAGLITYLMARLKADQETRNAATSVKVEEIQQALGRIESNRTNLAAIKNALEQHGQALVANAKNTASKMVSVSSHQDLRDVLEQHGTTIIATTQATVAKLAAIDAD